MYFPDSESDGSLIMRIAVASKSGTDVDQHFGHAERFLIYEFSGKVPRKLSEVHVGKYCTYDPDHPFRHNQLDEIIKALNGCKAVVTAQIGKYPQQLLLQAGITPVNAQGPICEALQQTYEDIAGDSRPE